MHGMPCWAWSQKEAQPLSDPSEKPLCVACGRGGELRQVQLVADLSGEVVGETFVHAEHAAGSDRNALVEALTSMNPKRTGKPGEHFSLRVQ